MKKYNFIFSIIASLIVSFSCTSNINSVNPDLELNKNSNVHILKVSGKGANIKGKIRINNFGIKQYKERKTLSDLKSVLIALGTANYNSSTSSFSDFTIINTLSIININDTIETLEFELRGLPPNINNDQYYYLEVYARDDNGTIINKNPIQGARTSDFIHIDNDLIPHFPDNSVPPPNYFFVVDLQLQDFEPDFNKFNVYTTSTTNYIKDLDMKLDNLGNGIITWVETDNTNDQICFKKVKEYIPQNINNCKTGINNVSSLSLNLNSIGEGTLLFLRNGNIDGYKINNYEPDNTIQNYVNSANANSFHFNTDSNGNGLIVYSKNHPNGNKAIYTHKILNYNPVNPILEGTLFYYDNNIVQKPQVAINSKGEGIITWEESSDGTNDFSVSSIRVENYNPPVIDGVGSVSLSTSSKTVSGSGTEFTKQFYKGSKIRAGSNDYLIDSVDSDTQLTLVDFPISNYSGPYQGLGINRKSVNQYSGTSGNSTLSFSLVEDFINPGLKIKIEQTGQKVTVNNKNLTDFGIVETLSSDVNSYIYTKETYSLNLPNTYLHRVPSIYLNESGNGIIAWKIYEPSTTPDRQDYIGYQRIKNFEIVDYLGDPYINYATNLIDLTNGYNELFTEDLSPIGIRINSFGNGDIFFSAKQLSSSTRIYYSSFLNYDYLGYIDSTDLDNSINPKTSLNFRNFGLIISLSEDKKSINAVHKATGL